jgi:hypothetical protein
MLKYVTTMITGSTRAAVEYAGPGEAIGLDFSSIMESAEGFKILMLVIDQFSRWRRMFALKDRQATTVLRAAR